MAVRLLFVGGSLGEAGCYEGVVVMGLVVVMELVVVMWLSYRSYMSYMSHKTP